MECGYYWIRHKSLRAEPMPAKLDSDRDWYVIGWQTPIDIRKYDIIGPIAPYDDEDPF